MPHLSGSEMISKYVARLSVTVGRALPHKHVLDIDPDLLRTSFHLLEELST